MKPLLPLLLLAVTLPSPAADWPTYRADDARSGFSPDPLPDQIALAWTWQSPHPPQPAWQGEAKWDGWNKVYDLKPRQIFDRAFHPVIAHGRVYFGSSADDQIHCLDAKTGQTLWTFFTDGPVRLAPTVHQNHLYFGSDDGCVYALNATTGDLLWRQRAVDTDRRIPGNGRIISSWPVRTSVVVRDGLLYTTAGMFPSEGVHLVAMDATTGDIRWRQIQTDLPAQGYLLASANRLYVPAGRNNPVVCDISNGQRLRVVEGAGGTYALLTGDLLVFGPGKTGQLGAVEEGERDQLATFQGNQIIVTRDRSFLQSDHEISALDRSRYLQLARHRRDLQRQQSQLGRQLRDLAQKENTSAEQSLLRSQLATLARDIDAATEGMDRCLLWRHPAPSAFELILAGNTLVSGRDHSVAGFDTTTGNLRWELPVPGKAYGLAAAHGSLWIATDQGTLACYQPAPLRTQNP